MKAIVIRLVFLSTLMLLWHGKFLLTWNRRSYTVLEFILPWIISYVIWVLIPCLVLQMIPNPPPISGGSSLDHPLSDSFLSLLLHPVIIIILLMLFSSIIMKRIALLLHPGKITMLWWRMKMEMIDMMNTTIYSTNWDLTLTTYLVNTFIYLIQRLVFLHIWQLADW